MKSGMQYNSDKNILFSNHGHVSPSAGVSTTESRVGHRSAVLQRTNVCLQRETAWPRITSVKYMPVQRLGKHGLERSFCGPRVGPLSGHLQVSISCLPARFPAPSFAPFYVVLVTRTRSQMPVFIPSLPLPFNSFLQLCQYSRIHW